MFKDKGRKAAPEVDPSDPRLMTGRNVVFDGKNYVVTRYAPGVFTMLRDGKFVDAIQLREIMEVVRTPDERVLPVPDFLDGAEPPPKPDPEPPTATPAKESK